MTRPGCQMGTYNKFAPQKQNTLHQISIDFCKLVSTLLLLHLTCFSASLKRPTWRGYAQSCADSGVTFEVGMWCSGVNLSTWAMWAMLRDLCLEILDIGIWNCPKKRRRVINHGLPWRSGCRWMFYRLCRLFRSFSVKFGPSKLENFVCSFHALLFVSH